jgi:His/Glu/Gln/Arg/opine family amino acid ABC transporter permease subunit
MDFIFIMEQMPRLLPGLLLTIQLSLIGFLIATILGVPFGILRAYKTPAYVSFVIDFYVFVVRGTPILVQIYAAYFLLPLAGVKLSPFWIGIVALSFNSAGYQIEITRAAIQSIEKGQYEGASSLGLGKFRTLISIVFPQAFLRMLPPLANEMSNLIKASSVLSIITVFELHKAANAIISDSFKFLEMLFAQAVLYVAFVVLMTQFSIYLEKRVGTKLQIKNFSQR